jgi:hypothetical protein
MPAPWLQPESPIEGQHADDLTFRDLEALGDSGDRLGRNIAELGLDSVKEMDQVFLPLPEFSEQLVHDSAPVSTVGE